VSCADDRPAGEQLELWKGWVQEPPGVEPAGDQAQVIPRHFKVGDRWLPAVTLPDIAMYKPAA
jgi:hypothetical protein